MSTLTIQKAENGFLISDSPVVDSLTRRREGRIWIASNVYELGNLVKDIFFNEQQEKENAANLYIYPSNTNHDEIPY